MYRYKLINNGNFYQFLPINSNLNIKYVKSDVVGPAVYNKVEDIRPMNSPNIEAVNGIKYDFNFGFRMKFPPNIGKYKLILKNKSNDNILFEYFADTYSSDNKELMIEYEVKYFMKYEIFLYKENGELIFNHNFDLNGKNVFIKCLENAIGDNISWMSFYEEFRKTHNCNLFLFVPTFIKEIFEKQYPDIKFLNFNEQYKNEYYASYYVGLFFGIKDKVVLNTYNVKTKKNFKFANSVLRVHSDEICKFDLSAERKIKEKYVCIACQASSEMKIWSYPNGWNEVVRYLKSLGYRVLCMDACRSVEYDNISQEIPEGAEDFTGYLPLQERIDIIKDADFFIGLSSGLSWIAWGCKIPVVLISGFTDPYCEFETPYRVYPKIGCRGCWNKQGKEDNHGICDKHFECHKNMTPEMVMKKINLLIKNEQII